MIKMCRNPRFRVFNAIFDAGEAPIITLDHRRLFYGYYFNRKPMDYIHQWNCFKSVHFTQITNNGRCCLLSAIIRFLESLYN